MDAIGEGKSAENCFLPNSNHINKKEEREREEETIDICHNNNN